MTRIHRCSDARSRCHRCRCSRFHPEPPAPADDPIGDALRADATAYWKLDETSGTRADSTGNGNDLTPQNAPDSLAGKVGNAVSFVNASHQVLAQAGNTSLIVDGLSFTLAGWVRLHNKDNIMFLIHRHPDEADVPYLLVYDNVNDIYKLSTTLGPAEGWNFEAPPINTWHFIVASFENNGGIRIEVNRGTPDENLSVGSLSDAIGYFSIGGRELSESPNNDSNADMDEWGFWHRLLTVEEKDYLYNSGTGRTLYP